MEADEIARLRALCAAAPATPGPRESNDFDVVFLDEERGYYLECRRSDAAFMCAAYNAIVALPALLDEVERLQRDANRLRALILDEPRRIRAGLDCMKPALDEREAFELAIAACRRLREDV